MSAPVNWVRIIWKKKAKTVLLIGACPTYTRAMKWSELLTRAPLESAIASEICGDFKPRYGAAAKRLYWAPENFRNSSFTRRELSRQLPIKFWVIDRGGPHKKWTSRCLKLVYVVDSLHIRCQWTRRWVASQLRLVFDQYPPQGSLQSHQGIRERWSWVRLSQLCPTAQLVTLLISTHRAQSKSKGPGPAKAEAR